MNSDALVIIVAAVTALIAWALTRLVESGRSRKASEEQKRHYEELLSMQSAAYDKTLAEIKESHEKALTMQSEALKAEMTAQTEALLKQREEELGKKAEETFKNISANIGDDLKQMKAAFDENKKAGSDSSAAFKQQFEDAVKSIGEQTKSIGEKADHLAEAMRGQKKMQGCWGETVLLNLFTSEGMVEGRDFDKEETLRDELGFVILSEDTEKKMRPDYILHFSDDQDVIVDAKVSLSAFADYTEATTDEARQDASKRNLEAIKEQVKRLASKKYSEYLKPGHKMVDYSIMFVPVYSALELAYQQDPDIWRNAYSQKVLITSSETIMPFLRMITLAWRNVEQIRNQQKIIEAAQNMLGRVADFSSSMAAVGKNLADAQKAYEAADSKLKDSGKSIVVSANQIIKLGVPMPANKSLPSTEKAEAEEEVTGSTPE